MTYEAVLSVDNAGLLLRPGMTATADVVVDRVAEATLVPNAALRFTPPVFESEEEEGDEGLVGALLPRPRSREPGSRADGDRAQSRVWVLRDGDLVTVEVVLGSSDGLNSEVSSGALQPGDQVVVDYTLPE